MHGVTTALVAFIFVCVIFPERVKNRSQFYAGFGLICVVVLLDAINGILANNSFRVFTYLATAVLQIGTMLVMFMAVGGLNWNDLKGELGNAYEVMRRGESQKEVIIPLTGQKPKVKDDMDLPSERINIDEPSSSSKPSGDEKIPLI